MDGFLEEPGDVDAQAARAVSLLTDTALYRNMSAAARKTASDRFCSSIIIPRYEAYYQEICGN